MDKTQKSWLDAAVKSANSSWGGNANYQYSQACSQIIIAQFLDELVTELREAREEKKNDVKRAYEEFMAGAREMAGLNDHVNMSGIDLDD